MAFFHVQIMDFAKESKKESGAKWVLNLGAKFLGR